MRGKNGHWWIISDFFLSKYRTGLTLTVAQPLHHIFWIRQKKIGVLIIFSYLYFILCILYLNFVFVFCVCILYLHFVFVFCKVFFIFYLYFVFVFFLYFVFVFCFCLLYFYDLIYQTSNCESKSENTRIHSCNVLLLTTGSATCNKIIAKLHHLPKQTGPMFSPEVTPSPKSSQKAKINIMFQILHMAPLNTVGVKTISPIRSSVRFGLSATTRMSHARTKVVGCRKRGGQ